MDQEVRRHFVESLYHTLEGVISPTPYLEITEGEQVDVKFLDGRGRLPSPNSTEVTILDLDIASLFFDDFHLLYEGVTGVGKTYTSDALFNALFGPDGHYTIRLSGGILGSSALEPFTTTVLENGVPKTIIDHEKCSKYGAVFIDEINRGDPNEVFQVVDGKIHVNGDTGYLQIPVGDTGRHKKVAIISAMNPADAEHSSALELDIAGENRFLKFRFPNGVEEAGSSQLDKIAAEGLHEQFWSEFRERSGVKGEWKDIYPQVVDSAALQLDLSGEAREFIDIALGYVGKDPKETYARNAELMKQQGITPHFAVRKSNDLDKVLDAQHSLKHGFVRRDLRKIRDVSRLLGFIKSIKQGNYEPSVNLDDVAVSIGVVLEGKTVTGSEHGHLMTLVNDALTSYKQLRGELGFPEEFYGLGYGVRDAVYQSAVNTGQAHGFEGYMNALQQGIGQLNTQAQGGVAQSLIRSRVVADLAVLEHFSKAYEQDVSDALQQGDKSFDALSALYHKSKGRTSVYEHRLDSLLR